MQEILKTTILGLFFGTFGTTIGGIIGIKLKRNSNKFLSFILSWYLNTYKEQLPYFNRNNYNDFLWFNSTKEI